MTAAGALFLAGEAGRLECLLRLPPGPPRFGAVVCHPHPLFGGTMHTKLVYRLAQGLAAAGGAALRLNFRGVGLSQGAHDHGRGEVEDARRAVDELARRYPGLPLLVAGFSFGAWAGMRAGARDGRVGALAGLGLSTLHYAYDEVARSPRPKLVVQGERDPLGPAEEVRRLVAAMTPPAELVLVAGAGHFFESGLEEPVEAVVGFARRRLLAGA